MRATEKQFIDLLQKKKGLQIYVAQALGISRQAVNKRIHDNPSIKAAYEQILEEQIDYAENLLMQNMGKGDTTALIFYLKCKAKGRGYVERQEITGKDGGPLPGEGMTEEQIDARIAELEKKLKKGKR